MPQGRSLEIGPRLMATVLGSVFWLTLGLVWSTYVWQNKQLELGVQRQDQQLRDWMQANADQLLPDLDGVKNPAAALALSKTRDRRIHLMMASYPPDSVQPIAQHLCRHLAQPGNREAWCRVAAPAKP
jgi:hypothetical protein